MAEVDGFRLQTAPVFHVKGVVRGDDGLAARVSVKLVPITKQPAPVVSSFGPYFLTAGEGDAPGPDEAHAITGDDGSFDFPAVRAGDWRIVAEGAPAADPLTGFNLTSSGVAAVIVQDADIANALVRLEAPFTLAGSRVQWLVAQCHLPNPPMVTNCPLDGRLGPQGTVYPVLFRALDGQSSSFKAAVTQPDGTFLLGPFHPGHYLVTPLPAMPNPALTDGRVNDYNGPGFSLPGESSTRHPLDLRPNSGPVELNGGGMFDPDGTRPVNPIARAGPGGVRGTVENGAGAARGCISWAGHRRVARSGIAFAHRLCRHQDTGASRLDR